MNIFVPVYVDAGLSPTSKSEDIAALINEAIDYQLTNKVLRKLEYEEINKDAAEKLRKIFERNKLPSGYRGLTISKPSPTPKPTATPKPTPTPKPDDDYERTWYAPETILIKGDADSLQAVESIPTTEIRISEMYEDTEVDLEYDLPEGIYIANRSQGKTIRIKVALKETEEDESEDTES